MELKLTVPDDLARKIKGLSVLSGLTASDICDLFSKEVEKIVTQKILESLGFSNLPEKAPVTPGSVLDEDSMPRPGWTSLASGKALERESGEVVVDPKEYMTSDDEEEDPDELEGYAESTAEPMEEEELPDHVQQEIGSTRMGIKDREGNATKFNDDFMNDLQDEAEEFEGQDDVIAAASGSGLSYGDGFSDDAPVESSTPDILPVDHGIDSINNNADAATAFFDLAFKGKSGDKTRRNGLARKRR